MKNTCLPTVGRDTSPQQLKKFTKSNKKFFKTASPCIQQLFGFPPFRPISKKIFFLDSTQNYKTIGENFIKIGLLEAELLHFENCTFIWKYENDVTIYKMKFS